MNTKIILSLCILTTLFCANTHLHAADTLIVSYQTRNSDNKIMVKKEAVNPKKIGIVVIDMWNWHWCKTSAARVSCMVPRMNKCLEIARKMGMQVFLCPTDVANNYAGTAQREKAIAVKKQQLPPSLNLECPHPGYGGCMCGEDNCVGNYGWDGMDESLVIGREDIISSGPEELYALCKEQGITQLWYMGVHTNNCVLGKPEGMKNMMNYGFKCALARDLQDPETFYDPEKGITPDDNNSRVVAHFERYLAPSINFVSVLKENKLWSDEWIVDPVRITPWGKPERSHQFTGKQVVTLTTPLNDGAKIYYTTDGMAPGTQSKLYVKPFEITGTTTIRTIAYRNGKPTNMESTAYFTKLPAIPPLPHIYLADLELREANRFSRLPEMNQAITKTKLKIHNKAFDKGIGTSAPSFLTYELKPGYTSFVAQCGIDDFLADRNNGREIAKFPSVIFKIFIDGKLVDESPVMRNSQWPWSFNISIPPGSRVINLVAANAGDGSFYDYANWVNAGFVTAK